MGQINFSCWEVTTRMESDERQGFKRKIHDASEKSCFRGEAIYYILMKD